MNNPNYGLKTFLLFVASIFLTPIAAYYNAFVLCKIYNWFVLPIPGAPNIQIGNMIGVVLIMTLMCATPVIQHLLVREISNEEKSSLEELEKNLKNKLTKSVLIIFSMFATPSMSWFIAYLYHNWFM